MGLLTAVRRHLHENPVSGAVSKYKVAVRRTSRYFRFQP
jgi:hypothetical protein